MIPAPPASCPCCQAIDWIPRWPGLVVCRRCGLMTVSQPFVASEVRNLYQEEYFAGGEYVDYLADKSAHQKTLARHLRLVQRYLPGGSRLLEIGCAHGFFLELAQLLYPGSVGVDVAACAVADARKKGLEVRLGDLAEHRFNHSFDGVCLWDTIEHLAEPYETLQRAVGLLKPGGYLFLSTGDFGALLPRLQGARWRQIHPPTHLFYFTRPSLRALCCRLGLAPRRFGTVRVYRRLSSTLQGAARLSGATLFGRLAGGAARLIPKHLARSIISLNLGDTLYLVAQSSS